VSQAVLRIEVLPAGALDAAAMFHGDWRGRAQSLLDREGALAIVMPPAPYDHADWRRAAARDLARAMAPKRVNLIAGDDERAVTAALAYLVTAPGVTGQYLPLDGHGAADPLD
jgi:hypothetical protein